MRFGILGPLLASEGDKSYVPTAPKQRQLMALLLMNANQVVPTAACIEEIWESRPPASALSTLQTYVLQLRRILGRAPSIRSAGTAKQILSTHANGYLLVASLDDFDLHRFSNTARQARLAAGRQHDRAASALFAEALTIWRGPALADVKAGPLLRARLSGIEESRLTVQEERIEADLRLGRHHELLSELCVLTAQHPTHENLYAQFMVALYRSGRHAEALEAFRRLRRVLADELGIEPSPRMHRLHQAVLACDPQLDVPIEENLRLSLDLVSGSPRAD